MTTQEIVKKVVDTAKLDSIHLKSSRSDIALPSIFVTPDITKVNIDYRFSHVFIKEDKILFSFVEVKVEGSLSPEGKLKNPNFVLENDLLFSCSSAFVAQYFVETELSDKECQEFTKTNAFFNIYPFLREHVNSELSKMGVQGVFLPLLKAVKTGNNQFVAEK